MKALVERRELLREIYVLRPGKSLDRDDLEVRKVLMVGMVLAQRAWRLAALEVPLDELTNTEREERGARIVPAAVDELIALLIREEHRLLLLAGGHGLL